MMKGLSMLCSFGVIMLLLAFTGLPVAAQSTAFTYQGKLSDNGNPANGSYDLQFKLFDTVAVGTGAQQGATVTVSNVTVSGGIFTVQLDFGACASCFNGAARFLEIVVKPTSGGTFTTLSPRQPITSTPYAINAAQLGGLAASGFLQNSTVQQVTSNFNISGNGTAGGTLSANLVNATTQFNLGGQRLLSATGFNNLFAGFNAGAHNLGSSNTFFGAGAGEQNTTGNGNSFFGELSGGLNTTGASNSFFGSGAGYSNIEGTSNSFFGQQAGNSNSTGSNNAFFGTQAGLANTTGSFNTFFGSRAGQSTTTGSNNAFFGERAGQANSTGHNNAFLGDYAGSLNTTGFLNTFVGTQAGSLNTSGSNNTFLGFNAGRNLVSSDGNTFIGTFADFNISNPTGSNNTLLGYSAKVNSGIGNSTAIGANATVTQSNSLVLGSINGVNGATADTNVGIGTTAPVGRLNIVGSAGPVQGVQIDNREIKFRGDGTGHYSIFANRVASTLTIEDTSSNFDVNTPGNVLLSITRGGNVGINKSNPNFTLDINGTLSVGILGTGGSEHLCRISFNQLALCSSSIRYKTNVATFASGLGLIRALTPVTFDWKSDGRHDLGLVAEDVERVSPLLVTYNNGKVEGVKYDRIGVILINAIKEQQAQIEKQQTQIESLRVAKNTLKQQNAALQLHNAEMDARLGAIERRLRTLIRRAGLRRGAKASGTGAHR